MNKPIAIATVIQVQAPTSAKPGDRALVGESGLLHGWVGGGCVQPAIAKISKSVLQSGQPAMLRVSPEGVWKPVDGLIDYSSSCLGRGSLLLFIEPIHTQPTLCILGQSAVAISLATQAINLKLNVVLQGPSIEATGIDPQIDVRDQYEAINADYIVIATQGNGDTKAIENAFACQCDCISMVVSEKKLQGLKQRLREDGFKQTDLDRLQGQAGLRIGAQLPEEIALSVLAEIVQLRRGNNAIGNTTEAAAVASGSDTVETSLNEPVDRQTSDAQGDGGSCCGG